MSNLRRQRGFAWERQIVKDFERIGWNARRLGGPGLPDVLAGNMKQTRMYIVEAKSGYKNVLYVPKDQIKRQIEWVENGLLPNSLSLLAFKFAKGHTPTYRYWLMPRHLFPCGISCRNTGRVSRTEDGEFLGMADLSLEILIERDNAT